MEWEALKAAKEGESLAVKGFLFQTKDLRWILSNEPDLRSCCIGSAHKQLSQINLSGDYSAYKINKPLSVRGVFHIEQNGAYSLSAVEVASPSFPYWTCAALGVCIIAAGIGAKLKRLLLP